MKVIQSFKQAMAGFAWAMQGERNFKIQLVVACLVVIAGTYFNCSKIEWMLLLLCISTVLAAELFNTVIEQLANKITIDYCGKIKIIKDCAAAAVTVVSVGAAIVGCIIFIPKYFNL